MIDYKHDKKQQQKKAATLKASTITLTEVAKMWS